MKNKPQYSIESVDHALRLALLLQQEGPMRGSEAAARLGVARSTAHRLLAMLVYRDFAEQGDDKRYTAGPALRAAVPASSSVTHLRSVALPHLNDLTQRTGETSNLQVRVADQIRIVATVECTQVLRVGDREGTVLPAHRASGGKALLAERPNHEVEALYAGSDDVDLPALLRELTLVRRRGFAINDQLTEQGVTALGRAIHAPGGEAVAAVSLAMPTARFSRARLREWVGALAATGAGIESTLEPAVAAAERDDGR
ncbi:MAG: IclR family transcriptional regulator [Jiangellaceae bacterium]